MGNSLVGKWRIDPDDNVGIELYGNVIMDFKPNGDYIYSIFEGNTEKRLLLKYKINGNVLITDQPSHEKTEETFFKFKTEFWN